ncbi:MAG: helix-turn-helix transcriptional regulator [Alphaproteobacteria bacterium]|nr:helix-turn-helix transcriptional regulator [Alphaproteobacteria bacterium]
MTHKTIWRAIERLAQSQGLSCSGLAKLSGLDSTTFNKSKQFSADGKPRWPSCATVAKIISATKISVVDFAHLCTPPEE